ncbi:aspartate-semialdehyde dehydrogenase [Chloroflexus sp. MS-CIW-1]|jgi:aspartate-semialdehyde dehydrogenase|uniref:aspartate-semialdehyde dehydrogenase n=1 Tax=unclassified Chloroflexus TaxID=2633855 RepID=UPI0004DECCD2|nr:MULTISPECIES: aspartate-semialdehyde dehydrogenase [unclassified Chloroflexus]MDN5271937.1 aspartate-semialdehyde dehydrogenase [Chloroflexus sp. MS-CIW-1]
MSTIPVAVLGATGAVGQRFIQLLEGHPLFRVVALTGSERSAGKKYREVCRWVLDTPMPAAVADLTVLDADADVPAQLVFSALPSTVAGPIEQRLAAAGHIVCSNASNHRMEPDVPLVIPEVNPDHLALITVQRRRRGWSGAIVTNPNCTSTPATMVLKPLLDTFGVRRMLLVSMQALSGAGYPGVPSYDIVDNVIPFIGGEEPKLEVEPQKMLGQLRDETIVPASFTTSAHCNRVPVLEGHLVCLSIELERKASSDEIATVLSNFRGLPQELRLPTAPEQPIIVRNEPDRPQPRRDRDAGRGMATVVGRIRPCSLFDIKLIALSHNTIRGAAGASILNAELMHAQGWLA